MTQLKNNLIWTFVQINIYFFRVLHKIVFRPKKPVWILNFLFLLQIELLIYSNLELY